MKINNHLHWNDLVNTLGETIPVPAFVAAATLAHHAAITSRSKNIIEDVVLTLATSFMVGIDYRRGSDTIKVVGKTGWFSIYWNGSEYRLTRQFEHHMKSKSQPTEDTNDIPEFMTDLPVELD